MKTPIEQWREAVEEALDEHATLYTRSSAAFITSGMSEELRNELWGKQDQKTKQAIATATAGLFKALCGDETIKKEDYKNGRLYSEAWIKATRNSVRAEIRKAANKLEEKE